MEILNVNVGPIVGHTTGSLVRLWGRGEPSGDSRKTHGVARVLYNGSVIDQVFFKMTDLWDYTGVAVLKGLSANMSYTYQLGYFYSDANTASFYDNSQILNWDNVEVLRFVSGSDVPDQERSYLIGSCRYNLPWASEHKDHVDTRGDKTFKTMLSQLDNQDTNGLIMLGDQIYADILGKGVSSPEGFYRLYRGAFRQDSLRRLMKSIPTYMILDDHEIEENWPAHRSRGDYIKETSAKYAYQAYQVSHSPLLDHKKGRLNGLPDKFWYTFEDGCAEFFMMDVRTERSLIDNEMVSEDQFNALKKFLINANDKVKIVGTAVPFFPDGGDDKWSGFAQQRARILDFIREYKLNKVVFITGDVHFSAAYDLRCDEDANFKVISLMCSPFFWPFPHLARLRNKNIEYSGYTYRSSTLTALYRKENFVRLDIMPDKIIFNVFSRKNNCRPVISKEIQFFLN